MYQGDEEKLENAYRKFQNMPSKATRATIVYAYCSSFDLIILLIGVAGDRHINPEAIGEST